MRSRLQVVPFSWVDRRPGSAILPLLQPIHVHIIRKEKLELISRVPGTRQLEFHLAGYSDRGSAKNVCAASPLLSAITVVAWLSS